MELLIYRVWEDLGEAFSFRRSCELVDDDMDSVMKQVGSEETDHMLEGTFFAWLVCSDNDLENGICSSNWDETLEDNEIELCESNFINSTR